MRQLSGTDSLFLRLKRGNQCMHVAGLGIYNASTAPEGKVRCKDVLRLFEARLDSLPLFRRRLGQPDFCMAKTQRLLGLSCGWATGNLAQRDF